MWKDKPDKYINKKVRWYGLALKMNEDRILKKVSNLKVKGK
jgi:hypothetical protein